MDFVVLLQERFVRGISNTTLQIGSSLPKAIHRVHPISCWSLSNQPLKRRPLTNTKVSPPAEQVPEMQMQEKGQNIKIYFFYSSVLGLDWSLVWPTTTILIILIGLIDRLISRLQRKTCGLHWSEGWTTNSDNKYSQNLLRSSLFTVFQKMGEGGGT